jgi:hypothetical protein
MSWFSVVCHVNRRRLKPELQLVPHPKICNLQFGVFTCACSSPIERILSVISRARALHYN